jgi:hypothetical protein
MENGSTKELNMPVRSVKKTPFSVQGQVTVDGSGYRGAIVWLRDYTTGGDAPQPVKGVGYAITDDGGFYNIGLTEIQSNHSDQDKITVSCITQFDKAKSTDTIIDITRGKATVNFTLVTTSGLVDGAKSSPLSDRSGALAKNQLEQGCKDGM